MMRKCSMCGEYKEESSCYRYMNHLGRYNAYCKKCEQWYNKQWKRQKSAKLKDLINPILKED